MDLILQDLSLDNLVSAIKDNFYDSFRRLKNSDQTDYYIGESFERWHTPIAHPWFNGVLASHLSDQAAERLIQESLNYFNEYRVTSHSWWLDTTAKLDAWQPRMAAYHYKFSQGSPGMAVDLNQLPGSIAHPKTLVIREVHDMTTFEIWSQVFKKGYGLPESVRDTLISMYASLGLEPPSIYYLGILDGQPVATSRLYLGAGVAGIYNVATIPETRGQGIGGALTLLPLHQARSMGYRAGVLHSSEMGFRLYQRLGFEQLCNMEYFYLTAGRAD